MRHNRVAIIGGGPAGAATALALLNTAGVANLDVTLYHRPAAKQPPRGETIPPAASTLLNELGIGHLLDSPAHVPCPGSLSVWGHDKPVANDFLLDINGQGYHLERGQFDSDLLSAAQSVGAHVKPDHTLYKVNRLAKGYELGLRCATGEKQVRADFVVDATGQTAAFARRLPVARNVIDEVISIYACMPIPSGIKLPDYTLLEATQGGWWYLAKIPDKRLILSLTTDKESMAAHAVSSITGWRRAYRHARWLGDILPETSLEPIDLTLAPACSAILTNCAGDRWLAAGDAACCFDSITSAGITRSLIQGKHAGAAIAEYFESGEAGLARYQQTVFDQFNRYIGLRNHLYGREQRFSGAGFWHRRQTIGQT